MGKKRKKAGKAKKRRRRRREYYALSHSLHFREDNRGPQRTDDVFPKELMELLNDEPELSAEESRLRAIERAKEAREKGGKIQ